MLHLQIIMVVPVDLVEEQLVEIQVLKQQVEQEIHLR
jgi:hypothetical protein